MHAQGPSTRAVVVETGRRVDWRSASGYGSVESAQLHADGVHGHSSGSLGA